jgi:cyanate permease
MLAFPRVPCALYLASVLFGLCIGNVLTLPSLIFQHEYASSAFARVLGSSTAIGQIVSAFVPAILGVVRDLAGPVLAVCAGLQLLVALVIAIGSPGRCEALRETRPHGCGDADRVVRPHL